MTKHECRNPKEAQMTNDEEIRQEFRSPSAFVLRHSFEFCHSDLACRAAAVRRRIIVSSFVIRHLSFAS